MPVYPADLPYPPWFLRVSEAFRIPLHVLDEEWTVDNILDEIEAILVRYDLDNPPR